MKIQANKKQTKKIADDMQILYNSSGIYAVINKYAKILAYQYALNDVTFEIYKEISMALTKENKPEHDRRKDS